MNKPLISVITPFFNSEKTVSETIESVIHQTYSNWELILVDVYLFKFKVNIYICV